MPISPYQPPPGINPEIPRPDLPPGIDAIHDGNQVFWHTLGERGVPRAYERRPENAGYPRRPWHVGYLIEMSSKNVGREFQGRPFVPLLGWHWYVCRACGGSFTKRQAPHMIRIPHCGCEAKLKPGMGSQRTRFEGAQFGQLIVVAYHMAHGATMGGWEAVCLLCGGTEYAIRTIDLRMLRRLACRSCVPEEYESKAGRRRNDSMHVKLLREHFERTKTV